MSIIASKLREEPYLKRLTSEILHSDDPAFIAALASRLLARSLGPAEATCFHFEVSVGATFGFEVGSERVMLKVYEPDMAIATAQAQTSFQRWLLERDFPCPPVLTDVLSGEGLVYRIERYVDRGHRANGRTPEDRKLMAQWLVRQIELGEQYPDKHQLPTHVLTPVPDSPWPKPHNVLFDFSATRVGAEWIDEVGTRYKSHVLELARTTIGHMDWGAKHCRIESDAVSVVYDWDSVCQASVAEVIGSAAANYMVSWYVEGANRPTLEELLTFVRDCAAVSRQALIAADIAACILYSAGYGARCEHAIRAETMQTENRDFLKMLLDVDLVQLIRTAINQN